MYFDSHCHVSLYTSRYKDIDCLLEEARAAGVVKIVDSAVDIESSRGTIDFYRKYPDLIVSTIGLHPELLISGSDIYVEHFDINTNIENLKKLYLDERRGVKAIGECGLDFYWLEKGGDLTKSEKQEIKLLQKRLFLKQIEFSSEVNLPLVVHSRGAEAECLNLTQKNASSGLPVLFHSFTGECAIGQEILKQGYYISFNGILTYPSAGSVLETFKYAWENFRQLILTETDAPYLAPQSKRGHTCSPSDVKLVVKKMAEVVGCADSEVAKVVCSNAKRFFDLV